MSGNGNAYGGPLVGLVVTRAPDGSFLWKVKLSAADAKGVMNLGYQASGSFSDLHSAPEQFEILVHDAERPVWTPMPLSHRKDIRETINGLLKTTIAVLKASKHT